VEEKIVGLLKEKQGLFDSVFGDISDPDRATQPEQLSLRELIRTLVE
jgi:hypothetical protein